MSKGSQGRLRVFFAEFEGDDQTIQESLKALSVAVTKTFAPRQIVVNRLGNSGASAATETTDDIINVEQGVVEDPDANVEYEPAAPRLKAEKRRKLPTLAIVKELNLRPVGKKSFRDFYAEKQPATQMDQIAVAVYYLRVTLETEVVSANHVFTCFKDVSVKVPPDLPQIIRNCRRQKGWVDPAAEDGITITTQGQNHVEHDLPPKAKK